MDEPKQTESAVVAVDPSVPPMTTQSPGPAFASAVLPGLGQLALGEKRKAFIYFALLAIWIFLFFPPVQSARHWGLWANQEIAGILLATVSTFQALRSRAGGKRPAHFALLIAVVPLAAISMAVGQQLLTRAAGFRDFRVDGRAMEPALRDKDRIMVSLREFRSHGPAHGEIVILQSPAGLVIKRVIAEGGDVIFGRKGQTFLNGQVLDEPYVLHPSLAPNQMANYGPITIPAHKFFVMGDNRVWSFDSRLSKFGLIDESEILGKALYIATPAHEISGHVLL